MHKKRREKLVKAVFELVNELSSEEKKKIFDEVLSESSVPVSIFKNNSGLEALVLYLKNNQKKSVKDIAKLLNRNVQTIYSTYNKIKNKKIKLHLKSTINIPLTIFSDRKLSILESLVSYLKEEQNLTLIKISKLIGKSQSTIKTVYWRYKKKCQKK